MLGKRKPHDSLVNETTKSAQVSKKSRSHSVIETTKSAPRTKKSRSHSTAANKKAYVSKKVKFIELKTYTH